MYVNIVVSQLNSLKGGEGENFARLSVRKLGVRSIINCMSINAFTVERLLKVWHQNRIFAQKSAMSDIDFIGKMIFR